MDPRLGHSPPPDRAVAPASRPAHGAVLCALGGDLPPRSGTGRIATAPARHRRLRVDRRPADPRPRRVRAPHARNRPSLVAGGPLPLPARPPSPRGRLPGGHPAAHLRAAGGRLPGGAPRLLPDVGRTDPRGPGRVRGPPAPDAAP